MHACGATETLMRSGGLRPLFDTWSARRLPPYAYLWAMWKELGLSRDWKWKPRTRIAAEQPALPKGKPFDPITRIENQ